MKLKQTIDKNFKNAFIKAGIEEIPMEVVKSSKAGFGDYQFNGAMSLAKTLDKKPRDIAQLIIDNIDFEDKISNVEIAGPGFINIWLKKDWVSNICNKAIIDSRLGIEMSDISENIVVDYSGPNMAKQMHVGHLRSTIIGDSLANLFSFLGHNVIRQNHIGDWGTQFGMLIAYLEEFHKDENSELKDLEQFYKDAKIKFEESVEFANKSRDYVVKIQSGDKYCLDLWNKFINISLGHCETVYNKLDVNLTRNDVRAESFYNNDLDNIINTLNSKKLLSVSNGAKCVFLNNQDKPVTYQKSDGGYLYATTDLAAIYYRCNILKADRICYVVDSRQKQHFQEIFETFKMCEPSNDVKLEHISFGTMLGDNGKPLKTREGDNVKLIDLLDKAVLEAESSINDSENLSNEELGNISHAVGIGAVKYFDLSINRESDYIFDFDKMLSFNGNTSLYMQYAYARIQSIFKKYDGEFNGSIIIDNDNEYQLCLNLLRFEDVLLKASEDCALNQITNYLYETATLFMRFYESNPILKEGIDTETMMSRLLICKLCAETIKKGLDILGIETLNKL